MRIKVFYDGVIYRLKKSGKVRKFLNKVIRDENRTPGDLNFIFTNDVNLHDINIKFLEHDYFTDVITFDYNKKNTVNGEIYISIETVKKNSINYKVSLNDEVIRVMIHGVLHLCGYRDMTKKQKAEMKLMEDKRLKEYSEIN